MGSSKSVTSQGQVLTRVDQKRDAQPQPAGAGKPMEKRWRLGCDSSRRGWGIRTNGEWSGVHLEGRGVPRSSGPQGETQAVKLRQVRRRGDGREFAEK